MLATRRDRASHPGVRDLCAGRYVSTSTSFVFCWLLPFRRGTNDEPSPRQRGEAMSTTRRNSRSAAVMCPRRGAAFELEEGWHEDLAQEALQGRACRPSHRD